MQPDFQSGKKSEGPAVRDRRISILELAGDYGSVFTDTDDTGPTQMYIYRRLPQW
jgi:hypothetical protein